MKTLNFALYWMLEVKLELNIQKISHWKLETCLFQWVALSKSYYMDGQGD